MCKQDETVAISVKAHPSWTRHVSNGRKLIDVDSCLADIVMALNEIGVHTKACCCGHGHAPGNIALEDGRELIIAPDFLSARVAERAFPNIQGNWMNPEDQAFAERVRAQHH